MWKSPRPFREEQISGTLVVCLPHYLQYFYSLLSTTVTGAQRWQNQWMSTNSQNQNHSRWRSGMWSPCGVGTLNAMSVPYAEHRSWVSSVSWYWHTIVTIGMVRTPVRPLQEGIQLLKERTWKHILYISPPPPKKKTLQWSQTMKMRLRVIPIINPNCACYNVFVIDGWHLLEHLPEAVFMFKANPLTTPGKVLFTIYVSI